MSSVKEAMDLLSRGGRLTTDHKSTALNSNSLRSHAVFSINLVSEDRDGNTNTVTRKLNLVDLAGSESQNTVVMPSSPAVVAPAPTSTALVPAGAGAAFPKPQPGDGSMDFIKTGQCHVYYQRWLDSSILCVFL